MQSIFKLLICCSIATFALTSAASAERRVALILGNSAYSHAPALDNPSNDAAAMASLLRSLNFEVVLGSDLPRQQMTKILADFSEKATGADAAVFFYAGHGIQLDGKNYLVPVDANLDSEMDVKMGATIDADMAIAGALSDAKVKLVFLDACRDNPFKEQITRSLKKTRAIVSVPSGLAEMKSGTGTLLAYATSPGEVALDGDGRNSPFTTALLKHLAEPGVDIEVSLKKVRAEVGSLTDKKQAPWANTNLEGFFYMNPAAPSEPSSGDAASSPAAGTNITAGAGGADAEMEFWRSVKDSKTVDELRAYLTKYPSGVFNGLARTRIAAIESGVATANSSEDQGNSAEPVTDVDPRVKSAEASEATEKNLKLGKGQWQVVQSKLKSLGFFSGRADGTTGASSRLAISKWQAERTYIVSGYLNEYQYKALLADEAAVSADAESGGTSATAKSSGKSKVRTSSRKRSSGGGGNGSAAGAAVMRAIVGGALRRGF